MKKSNREKRKVLKTRSEKTRNLRWIHRYFPGIPIYVLGEGEDDTKEA